MKQTRLVSLASKCVRAAFSDRFAKASIRWRPLSGLVLATGLAVSSLAMAQVRSEADLFGGPETGDKKPEPVQPNADKEKDAAPTPTDAPKKSAILNAVADSALVDTMQIGGRLELRANASKVDDQRFQESPYTQNKTADIYFDTRPNQDTRAFLRLRFQEDNRTGRRSESTTTTTTTGDGTGTDTVATTTEQKEQPSITSSIDELWFKWDINESVFVTAGKQHVKWGRGRFWNPTDFTALEPKDPFALFDRRLGQEMIKLHLPFEKEGHNLYAIVQFDDTERNDDVGFILRGEFAIGESGETAVSVQSKRGRPLRLGVDFGMGFANFDVNLESAWLTRNAGPRFVGDLDLQQAVYPSRFYDDKKVYNQSVANIEYVWMYSDNDNMTLGLEGFWNEMGYDSRLLEFYSLIQNESKVLYAGKQYVASYARLSAPGTWDDTTFILNAMQNISDKTALIRLTSTYMFYEQITLEAYVSRCLGEYGELCFKVPDAIIQGIATLPPALQSAIGPLPRKTTRTVFGGSLTMNF